MIIFCVKVRNNVFNRKKEFVYFYLIAQEKKVMSNHNETMMLDAAASVETAYMMSTDEPFEGTITNTEGDTEDWIGIELEAGTTYTITVEGTLAGAGGAMDTILRLIDSKGTAFMMNDDDTVWVEFLLVQSWSSPRKSAIPTTSVSALTGATRNWTIQVIIL